MLHINALETTFISGTSRFSMLVESPVACDPTTAAFTSAIGDDGKLYIGGTQYWVESVDFGGEVDGLVRVGQIVALTCRRLSP